MTLVTALIPAAGNSSRLGRAKQLVRTRDGEPLVHRAARLSREAGCARVLVVEGAVSLRDALVGLDVELVRCDDWAKGPGASLRAGAAQLGADETALVWLVDQWGLDAVQLRALLAAPGDVAAAFYDGGLGVPARFAPSHTHVLRALPDAAGARAWLRANAARVTAVELPEAAVDLDTPAHLEHPFFQK